MAECAALTRSDTVLDIGAGLGFLTRFLAEKCGMVLAVEADSRLASVLRRLLEGLPNVVLVESDVFKVQLPQFNKVVSIPPYRISSALVQWLFDKNFDCAVLVLQKEFAHRLVAPIGSADYGWLTVLAYYHFKVGFFGEVSRWAFYPPPEVDSVIVGLKPRTPPPFNVKNKGLFRRLTQALFTQRNRKVRNAIQAFVKKEHLPQIADSIPFKERRVRELAPEDFGALANVFAN